MKCALSIAGSDSIGGAGIQADVKAMAFVGVHAHTVVTAITAQNTCSVKKIMPIPTDMIESQLEAVLSDSNVRSIKTGMLYSAEIVETVADILDDVEVPIIVDPVMVAGIGDSLATDDLLKALKRTMIPICDILTPNRYEAEMLTGMKINNENDARTACELLGKEGTTIYLKGGHMDSNNVVDTLYNGAEFKRFEYPRLERAGHGGGCTLSAYITAHLANGLDAINSIIRSREMIQDAIANMYAIGKCDKVVNPMAIKMQLEDSSRSNVLEAVNSVSDKIIKTIPSEWIPERGMFLNYSLQSPQGPQDVASLRMTASNGKIRKSGDARFGMSDNVKTVLLAMKQDQDQRAAVDIVCSDDLQDIIEEVGLSVLVVKVQSSNIEQTSQAMKKHSSVPDVIIFNSGKENTAVILGKDPEDLLKKINSIL